MFTTDHEPMTGEQQQQLTALARNRGHTHWHHPASHHLHRSLTDIRRHGLTTDEANLVITALRTQPAKSRRGGRITRGNRDRAWALSMTGITGLAYLGAPASAVAQSALWGFGVLAALLWLLLALDWAEDWFGPLI